MRLGDGGALPAAVTWPTGPSMPAWRSATMRLWWRSRIESPALPQGGMWNAACRATTARGGPSPGLRFRAGPDTAEPVRVRRALRLPGRRHAVHDRERGAAGRGHRRGQVPAAGRGNRHLHERGRGRDPVPARCRRPHRGLQGKRRHVPATLAGGLAGRALALRAAPEGAGWTAGRLPLRTARATAGRHPHRRGGTGNAVGRSGGAARGRRHRRHLSRRPVGPRLSQGGAAAGGVLLRLRP